MDELIQAGSVIEVHGSQALVKVNVLGRETDWLPVLQQANAFKKHYVSMRLGEQVVVLANRYVVGSIFNTDCKEPSGSSNATDIVEYEDGTRFEYNTQSKTLVISCVGDVTVTCKNAVIDADSVAVNSQDIALNNGVGVVTGDHICMFTGNPHADCSQTVTAGK